MSPRKPADHKASAQLPQFAKESAEQIWQAGLGAFSKAQQEGGKIFNTLVQDGLALQRQAQAVAQEQLHDASKRLNGLAADIGSPVGEPLGKLEQVFEARVAKALARLGIPSSQEVQELREQIAALNKTLQQTQMASRTTPSEDEGIAAKNAPHRPSTKPKS